MQSKDSRPSLPEGRPSTHLSSNSNQKQSPEEIENFVRMHGCTLDDIHQTFLLIARDKDKKKITHADIKCFISTYFDNFPEEAMTTLNSWKEEVTEEQMISMLVNRSLLSQPFENAMKWFSDSHAVSKKEWARLAKRIGKSVFKRDIQFIIDAYDYDKDGEVGLEDLKNMSIKH